MRAPDRGFWFAPTLFTDVSQSHRIAREEIFGPVLSVLTFRTPEEAVEKANNTMYGLSAGVWTDKGAKSFWVAQRLRAGVIWANTYNKFDPSSPFGGYKESGFGREGGRQGLLPTSRWTEMAAKNGGPKAGESAKTEDTAAEPVSLSVRKAYKMYVGGAFIRSESGRYTQVAEAPGSASKENIPRASRKDGRDAVVAARGLGRLGGPHRLQPRSDPLSPRRDARRPR